LGASASRPSGGLKPGKVTVKELKRFVVEYLLIFEEGTALQMTEWINKTYKRSIGVRWVSQRLPTYTSLLKGSHVAPGRGKRYSLKRMPDYA